MKKADRINAEVRALVALDLRGLRDAWSRRYGDPPTMRSRALLARLLAWKIQADTFGGLDAVSLRRLAGDRPQPLTPQLEPGAILSRVWMGQRHDVEVLTVGFRYQGQTYRSLSEIARTITGTRWNGLRFFGLRGIGK